MVEEETPSLRAIVSMASWQPGPRSHSLSIRRKTAISTIFISLKCGAFLSASQSFLSRTV
jgi:hypothetical protein